MSRRFFREGLISDLGLEMEVIGKSDSEVFMLIMDSLRAGAYHLKKGTQVNMCRFANWVDKAAEFDQTWTWTLLRLVHYALVEGLMEECKWQSLFKASGIAATPGGDEDRVEMTRGNDGVKQFRAALSNNVELSLAMMLEPTSRAKARLLSELVAPIRKWYGQQSHKLRSCPAFLGFLKEQLLGRGIYSPLRDSFRLLGDSSLLDKVGLQVSFPAVYETMSPEHPVIADQDGTANPFSLYISALVVGRFKRLQFLTHGWTGRQVEFLSPEAEIVDKAKGSLISEHMAFQSAQEQTGNFWKLMTKRSYINLVPTQQLIQMMARRGGEVTDDMKEHIARRLSGIGPSKVCEDCMNVGRRLELSSAHKQQQTPTVLWKKLLDVELSNSVYKYGEVQWKSKLAPVGQEAALPKSTFECGLKQSPKWVGKVVGSGKAQWFSTSATYSNIVFADAFLMKKAHGSNMYGKIAANSFLAQLAGGHNLAVCPKGARTWFYCLAHQHGIVVIGWPCKAKYKGSALVELSLDLDKEPCFLLVCDGDWLATTVKWCSPAGALALGKVRPADVTEQPRIDCQLVSPVRPLLEKAAHNGFWDIKGAGLKPIRKFLGLALPGDMSDLDKLLAMIRKILPKLSDEQALSLLEKRVRDQCQLDDLLMFEEAEDLVDEQDRNDFMRHRTEMQSESARAARLRSPRSGRLRRTRAAGAAPLSRRPAAGPSRAACRSAKFPRPRRPPCFPHQSGCTLTPQTVVGRFIGRSSGPAAEAGHCMGDSAA